MKKRPNDNGRKLKRAIEQDDLKTIRALVKTAASANQEITVNDWIPARTLLAYASERRAQKAVRFLVQLGTNLNLGKYFTPLTAAAHVGDFKIVKYLLDSGANSNATISAAYNVDGELKEDPGWTPLMSAAAANQVEVANLLLNAGADPNLVTKKGRSALGVALENRNLGIVDLLLRAGASKSRLSVLPAVNEGDVEWVKTLLKAGADPDAIGRRIEGEVAGQTPLEVATRKRADTVANIENSLKLAKAFGRDERKVLREAAQEKERYRQVICELLKAGANVNQRAFWKSSVYMAAEAGDLELVELLLEAGAVPDDAISTIADRFNDNALHVAVREGHAEVVHALLRAGANTRKLDSNGKTPLDLARKGAIAKILKASIPAK